jgi:hypothetical protein
MRKFIIIIFLSLNKNIYSKLYLINKTRFNYIYQDKYILLAKNYNKYN